MKSSYSKLGDFITESKLKNKDSSETNLVGLSNEKQFTDSKANIIGADLSRYKLITENQFVYMPTTSRNGDKISVALFKEKSGIISSSYTVFDVNSDLLNPEYLMLWFERPEFDRYARYHSHGSVREIFSWEDMQNTELFIPPLEHQNKVVKIKNLIDNRISILTNINKNLDEILDLLFKEKFSDNFSNNINGWKIKLIDDLPLIITDYVANGSFASLKENVSILDYEDYAYFIRNTDLKSKSFHKFVDKHSYDFLKKSSLYGNEILISNVGDVGSVYLCPFLDKPMTLGNNMILVKSKENVVNLNFYLFLLFRSNYGQYLLSTITTGSVQRKFNKTGFKSLKLTMPNDDEIIKFNKLVSPIFDYKNKVSNEINNLIQLRNTLVPKLMTGEIEVTKIHFDSDV